MILGAAFCLLSAGIVWLSWEPLHKPGSHGFYRFFAWELILGLLLLNLRGWFANPFAWHQVISWILLAACLVPLIWGVILLRRVGRPTDAVEATTQLVTTGIYRLIRHPLYASLLLLTWGIFFKSPSLLNGCLASVASACLYATARADEAECLEEFGQAYADYMQRTHRFLPFIF